MIKKIIRKKVVAPIVTVPKVEMHLLPAIDMEEGVEYAGIGCNSIVMLNKIIPYEGAETGLRTLRGTVVECTALSSLGCKTLATYWGTSAVLADCPDLIKQIRKEYEGMAKYQSPTGAKAKPVKRDEEGNVIARPVKEHKSRGDADPRTGCSQGTQGHVLGTIMLDNKCSPATRSKIMPLMQAVLVKDYGFDEKKAKGLASSWYSTLWTRKPGIYQKGK